MSDFKARIRANIERHGHHVTTVQGCETPRFTYTIGRTEQGLPELLLAGGATLTVQEVYAAIEAASGGAPVHESWARALALGAFDICGDGVRVEQVVPDDRTIDVPDMTVPWDPEREPVWRWLHEPWPYDFPSGVWVGTDVHALRGAPITEAFRWEPDHWELFSGPGPDFAEHERRLVPFATLLGYDPTLDPVARLPVERGLMREPGGEWRDWS